MNGVTPGRTPGTGPVTGSGAAEEQLRDVFDALVTSVHGTPDRYPAALADWRRRERRRRIVLPILAAVIFALANILGLWALSRADVNTHIIFNDRPGNSTEAPTNGIGPPP
ncbi:hypothetical protein Drose_23915 [Dactylosporangium roseum]|uniref:Uncharacterized protein n=1 Tax=Dactylosporangium roseum TaxID=47989 RepID=A0ABY5YXZ5_9ACTN|nr:hypothetical protein [Dactylosporangium roseum]UWZ34279.1 hypothetical protein Drose_23915 [Dactylosporangium roseum]